MLLHRSHRRHWRTAGRDPYTFGGLLDGDSGMIVGL